MLLRRYLLFAVIATLFNLLLQKIALTLYAGPYALVLAMAAGTAGGLVLKYLLDKRFVFFHRTASLQQEGTTFTRYTLMGVFTTLIFWAVEGGFYFLFPYEWAIYVGGAIGLAIGYTLKYHLDRRFVFRQEHPAGQP